MLKLNLLSKEAKKEIKYKRLYSIIARVDLMLIIGATFLAVVFTGASIILTNNFKEFTGPESILRKNGQEYNNKIKSINEKLNAISKIQSEFIPSSLLIKELTDRIPAGVSLSYVKADIANRNLKIMGRAKGREDFLLLKESLANSKVFTEVDSPLQNILQKENIDFEISIKLDLSQLETE